MITDKDRDSRFAIGSIAAAGTLETAYLTWSKVSETPVASALCSESSKCGDVLSGPFSNLPLIELPLSSIGMLGYGIIATLAFLPVVSNSVNSDNSNDNDNSDWNGTMILALSTGMATFSGYLLWLLTTILKTNCTYCFLSAALSFSMATIAANDKLVRDKTKAFVVSSSSLAISLLSSGFIFYSTSLLNPDAAQASTAPVYQAIEAEIKKANNQPPPLNKKSTPRAIAVAERIQKADGKMFGAYWCSHCFNQKNELGIEASKYFQYLECDKEGKNSQYPVCKAKKIPGYPTWELYGEYFPGEKSLGELEELLTTVEKKQK